MAELQILPPPADAIGAMLGMPFTQITPTILATQQGATADGQLGPEAAGAVLMLQATFDRPDGAAGFWAAAVPLLSLLATAPGFIRRYSFPDGPSITLIVLWRTADDARAFAATPEHRAAVRDLYGQRWQYSHFSAIWELTSHHGRIIFCDRCDGITPASAGICGTCGADLVDVHRRPGGEGGSTGG